MKSLEMIFEQMMTERSRGDNYDDWNLQQVGLDKGNYLHQPASQPPKEKPMPRLLECPHCHARFWDLDGEHDA